MQRPFFYFWRPVCESARGWVELCQGCALQRPLPLNDVDFGTSFAEWLGEVGGYNGAGICCSKVAIDDQRKDARPMPPTRRLSGRPWRGLPAVDLGAGNQMIDVGGILLETDI
jgi:hypothetical protein